MDAYWTHGVFFAWVGMFIIELRGTEKVLKELPSLVRVLGLDAVSFDGRTSDFQMDYRLPNLSDGIPVDEALAMIAGWPLDKGFWIEPTLSSGVAPWS